MTLHGYREHYGIKHRERIPWYRARVMRDWAMRWGTYEQWRAAEARVRELTPREAA